MTIYCSGIGGIGLSAYAAYQHASGHKVLGSDASSTALTDDLVRQGIAVVTSQDGGAIPDDTDLFVYSEAIPPDAPERRRATELGIPQQSYFGALGDLSKDCTVIAVCGTHGKSSTTAMAARVLIDAGVDPNIIVGTKIRELDGRNWRKGSSSIFLLEACEYRHSFHFLHPDLILMTSVDGDHFDFYTSQEAYEQAYVDFIRSLPEEGTVVTHGNDPFCARVAARSGRTVHDADPLPLPSVATPGRHMQENAQLVLALAGILHLDRAATLDSLSRYNGCWRRMEVKGDRPDGVTVIDDYGHHPAEIRATLAALKGAYAGRRLVCVFQPHTHDRTIKLYDAFREAFLSADLVVLSDVYEARKDIETARVETVRFARDIADGSSVPCLYGGSLAATEQMLRTEAIRPGDVLVCMGAGTITNLATALMRA